MAAKQSNKEAKLGLPVAADVISEIIQDPGFLKIVDEIIALPEDKRSEFVEKELGREGFVKRGIRPRGTVVKFRPADKSKSKKDPTMNKLMRLDIYIPSVGILSLRKRY